MPTVFEALVDSVVEQQISLKVAYSLEHILIKKFGDIITLEDEVCYVYPTPKRLASVSTEEFRQCCLSFRRQAYQRSIQAHNGGMDR